jgi:hypothetical protein
MNRQADYDASRPGDGPHADKGRTTGTPAALVIEALTRMSGLFRREMDLARAEMDESLKNAALAAGLLVAAVVIALSALNVLAAALVVALTDLGIDVGWASLAVGATFAILALVLAAQGAAKLKAVKLGPQRVAENVKADLATVREHLND